MRPLEPWLDSQGPEDVELRMALLDAREGPSAAQVEAIARRVAERAATLEALHHVPHARARLVWRSMVGVGLLVTVGVLLWPRLEREERHRVTLPTNDAAPRIAAPAQSTPSPAVAAASAEPAATELAPKARTRRQPRPDARANMSPADEVPLLQEARRALLAHPSAALTLAQQHRQQFSHGAFVEERASIEVEALWRLGRFREARQAWEQFARKYPHSAYRQRLERLWSEAPNEL